MVMLNVNNLNFRSAFFVMFISLILLWQVENPMGVLADILHQSGRGEPEPRLIFQSGQETLQAVYHVGVYSDKKFMGSGKIIFPDC